MAIIVICRIGMYKTSLFDGVIVNPPFYDYESGAKPTSDERAVALHDKHTSLQEVLKAVQSFIKCKGRFVDDL